MSIFLFTGCKSSEPPLAEPRLALPARPAAAPLGTTVARLVAEMKVPEREQVLVREVLSGNVPDALRSLVPIRVAGTIDGRARSLTYWVTSDYVSVGSSADSLRIPLRASTAQKLADRLGCMLPTKKMVDDIHRAAVVRLSPRPFHPDTHDITSVGIFAASHRAIEEERAGRPGLISGIKKDIVVSDALARRPGRVAIYGWHKRDGRPIQPLSTAHTDPHVDYSHGVRLVHRTVLVDGVARELPLVLADPVLWPLVSDEGPIVGWRYGR